jgi:hypothetical protein
MQYLNHEYVLKLSYRDTAETETEVAEKSSWDKANRGEKLGLVWRNRKKISQIINDFLCLPFFLLIILCRRSLPPPSSLEILTFSFWHNNPTIPSNQRSSLLALPLEKQSSPPPSSPLIFTPFPLPQRSLPFTLAQPY